MKLPSVNAIKTYLVIEFLRLRNGILNFRLNIFLANLKTVLLKLPSQTKTFVLTHKKPIILIIFVYVILVGITSFVFSVQAAAPGDFTFTVKALYENSRLNSFKNGDDQVKYIDSILLDRFYAYKKLANTNNCVQVLLVEDDINNYLKKSFDIVANLSSQSRYDYLSTIKGYSTILNGIQTTCGLRKDLSEIGFVYGLLMDKLTVTDSEISEIQSDTQALTQKYNDYSKKISEYHFVSQNDLNKIVGISLSIKKNNTFLSSNSTDYITKKIKVRINNDLFTSLDNNFKDISSHTLNLEDAARFICNFSKDANCSDSNFRSKWNSVNGASNVQSEISTGETVFEQYLSSY